MSKNETRIFNLALSNVQISILEMQISAYLISVSFAYLHIRKPVIQNVFAIVNVINQLEKYDGIYQFSSYSPGVSCLNNKWKSTWLGSVCNLW